MKRPGGARQEVRGGVRGQLDRLLSFHLLPLFLLFLVQQTSLVFLIYIQANIDLLDTTLLACFALLKVTAMTAFLRYI